MTIVIYARKKSGTVLSGRGASADVREEARAREFAYVEASGKVQPSFGTRKAHWTLNPVGRAIYVMFLAHSDDLPQTCPDSPALGNGHLLSRRRWREER